MNQFQKRPKCYKVLGAQIIQNVESLTIIDRTRLMDEVPGVDLENFKKSKLDKRHVPLEREDSISIVGDVDNYRSEASIEVVTR